MQIFTRRKKIRSNLDDFELERLMTFPKREEADLHDFYLQEIFNKDHVQVGVVKRGEDHIKGIHDFEYDRNKKELIIFSRLKKSSFRMYAFLVFPLLPFFLSENVDEIKLKLVGITIVWFVFISVALILGIKFQSKEIEREMIIRINYFRGKVN